MEIISGKKKKPINVMMLGVEGIGKSTWASFAPKPLFIGAEENDELNVDRGPKPGSWPDFKKQVEWIYKNNPDHKTIVIDTIDSVQKILHGYVLEKSKNKTSSMNNAHGGYGGGYDFSQRELIELRDNLAKIRDELDKNIIILCHTKKQKVVDPILDMEYDAYQSNLHWKEEVVFKEWVSAVLFATWLSYMKEMENTQKKTAIGDGERVIFTEQRPGFLAKNRYELPFELEMPSENPFRPFYEHYNKFFEGKKRSVKEIRENIIGLLENVSDGELYKKVTDAANNAGEDTTKLENIEKHLKERIGQ